MLNISNDNIISNISNLNYNYHLLALTKDEDLILVYDLKSLNYGGNTGLAIIKTIQAEKNKISDFKVDYSNSVLIITSSSNESLSFYSLDNYELISTLQINNSQQMFNTSLDLNSDKKLMVTAGNDAACTLWDLRELHAFKVLKKTDYLIKKAILSHDCKYLCVIYDEPLLDVFCLSSYESVFSINRKLNFNCACWNPVNLVMVFNGEDPKNNNKYSSNYTEDGIISLFSAT